MMKTALAYWEADGNAKPRSSIYKDKTIIRKGYITIKGMRYYKRTFADGSVELVCYDFQAKKWVFLCFTA